MPARKKERRRILTQNTASAKSEKGFSAVNLGRRYPKMQVGPPAGVQERRKGPFKFSVDVHKTVGSGANTFTMTDRRKEQLDSGGVQFTRTKKKNYLWESILKAVKRAFRGN